MKLLQFQKLVTTGQNLILYKKDVWECYKLLKNNYRCTYIDHPRPVKAKFIQAIKELTGDKYGTFTSKTIPELQKILIEESKEQRLIILFNYFEDLTGKMIYPYRYLHENGNIAFVASFTKYYETQGDLQDFYETFQVVNEEELKREVSYDDINITYPTYLFIAGLLFIVYLKAASSLFIATVLIGAIWFAFLVFRTLIYVGGRV